MRKVVIISGVSGSGKSTYATKLVREECDSAVVSADHYFMKTGEYRFDPSKLSQAHAACFRNFITAMQEEEIALIIVDNTNTTSEEIAPYVLGAQAFGYEVEIMTLRVNPEVAAQRNVHGVPEAGVLAQVARLAARRLPPWWKNTDIEV